MSGIRHFKLMLVYNLENLEGGSLLQFQLSLRSDISKRRILSGETRRSSKGDNSCEKNSPLLVLLTYVSKENNFT